MNKKLKIGLIAAVAAVLLSSSVIAIVSIANNNENPPANSESNDNQQTTFTISFVSNGGSDVASIVAKKGEKITEPSKPSREYYVFKGWYGDENLTSKYVFLSMPASDITLYAKWEAVEAGKIVFDSCGGSFVESIFANQGETINLPENPYKEGYDFAGWYLDSNYNNKFDSKVFDNQVTVLYAKWNVNDGFAIVNFNINGNENYQEVIEKGNKIKIPEYLLSDDLVVENWYTDDTYSTIFDLNSSINDEITIYGSIYSKGLIFNQNEVVNYTNDEASVVVPIVYGGFKINSIGNECFYKKTNMKNLSLPNSINKLGNRSLYGCNYLETIELDNVITSIGEYCFYQCNRLESVPTLDVTIIPDGTFTGCKAIKNVNLSDNITSIGEFAFASCSALEDIKIPLKVETIDNYAFSNCVLLKEINLPSKVSFIGDGAFMNTPSIQYFTIDSNNPNYKVIDGNLYNSLGNTLILYIQGQKSETSFVVPSRVSTIKKGAFSGNKNLTNLDISGVVNIEKGALKDMQSLEILTIDTIGYSDLTEGNYNYLAYYFGADSALENGMDNVYVTSSLHTVVIKGTVTTVEDYAFYGVSNLKKVEGLENITSIGNYAFAYTALESFKIETGVETIGYNAFYGCNELETFSVGRGNQFFASSNGYIYNAEKNKLILVPNAVKEIELLESCKSIGAYAFASSSIKELTIPTSITSIDQFALSSMDNLETLTIPYIGGGSEDTNYMAYLFGTSKSVNDSGKVTFDTVDVIPTSLAYINITGNITKIDDFAFAYFPGLKEVNFSNSITEIGKYAFYQCVMLTKTGLNNNIETIGEFAYAYCISLPEVIVPGSVKNFGSSAFFGCLALTKVTIEEGVTTIPEFCFVPYAESDIYGNTAYYSQLVEVSIASSVETIEQCAFIYAGSYNDVDSTFTVTFENIENSKLKKIGPAAFEESALVSIVLPASLETLDTEAFALCKSLKSITFGNEVQGSAISSFGQLSMYYLTSLETVYIYKNITSAEQVPTLTDFESDGKFYSCFYSSKQGFKIYVSEGSRVYLEADEKWAAFATQFINL